MTIGLFGKMFQDAFIEPIQLLVDTLFDENIEIKVYSGFHDFISQKINFKTSYSVLNGFEDIESIDCLISIGGDGTLLNTIQIIRDSQIPILGVNTGRLGFLSNVSIDEIVDTVKSLKKQNYIIDKRSLIEVKANDVDLGDFNFAMNEITLQKRETSSMVTIHAYMDEVLMNMYWADGLIISTPTGSTAYSLSCGGPIVMPGSENLILTPIAPHNLNVRPLVVPNDKEILLRAESRDASIMLTLDSRSFPIKSGTKVRISKAPFCVNLINLPGQNFFNAIRNKLSWGMDKRN